MKKIILALCLVAPTYFFAQLTVSQNGNAAALAQAITGAGVTISNATINCGSAAAGTFSYAGSTLGIQNGIILTTGHAADAAQAASNQSSTFNGNNFSDPNLTSISSGATNDVCLLTFNFVPVCNSISITYVFGSEEYSTYECSAYNDAFGIFLTGPNPSGTAYSGLNIAQLPNGVDVSINNVNDGQGSCTASHNPSYYNANYNGSDIVFNGLTVPVTSVKSVVPCSTYTMKIAIADAGDEALDSGVFLKSNAVTCQTAPSASVATTPVSCGGSTGTASVTVSNYTATPTYQWLPGGQNTPSLSGLAAGTYTCIVGFQTACSTFNQTLTAVVANTGSNLSLTTNTKNTNCSGTSTGSATVTINGGSAPFTTQWSTSPVQTSTVINNLPQGTYTVTVHDNSGCVQTSTAIIGVNNITSLQSSNITICGNTTQLSAPAGTSYQWYDTSYAAIPGATGASYTATNIHNGQHYVVAFTDNTTGCRDSIITNISTYKLNFAVASQPACSGGATGEIDVNTPTSYTFTSYNWNVTGPVSSSATNTTVPFSVPNIPQGTYTVTVSVAGNPSCAYTGTVNITQTALQVLPTQTVTGCNLDTLKVNPVASGSSVSHWYTSPGLVSLGTYTANSPLLLYPQVENPGNYVNQAGAFYIDTIKTAAGCKSVLKVTIVRSSFDKAVSITKKIKCYGDASGEIKVNVPRENNGPLNHNYTFQWEYPAPLASPSVTVAGVTPPQSSVKSNLPAGTYSCVIRSGNCIDSVKVTLTQPAPPTPDTVLAFYCPKDSLALLVADTGLTNYQWYNNHVAITAGQNVNYHNDSIFVITQNINNYEVKYTRAGCPDTGNIIVHTATYNAFHPDTLVNVFTPNGDKKNDFFYPFHTHALNQYQIGKQSDTYEIHIYDRWGKEVFSSTDYSKPWDGKTKGGADADNGSYFYIVKFKGNCGTKADLESKKGFLELLR